jgi:hypothetical protein
MKKIFYSAISFSSFEIPFVSATISRKSDFHERNVSGYSNSRWSTQSRESTSRSSQSGFRGGITIQVRRGLQSHDNRLVRFQDPDKTNHMEEVALAILIREGLYSHNNRLQDSHKVIFLEYIVSI